MLGLDIWKVENRGSLSLDACGFRLLVEKRPGSYRFLVLQPWNGTDACSPSIMASGFKDDARAAMNAAEARARCLAAARGWNVDVGSAAESSGSVAP